MLLYVTALGLLLSNTPGLSDCAPDADGYCTSTVVHLDLSYDQPDVELRLNTTIGNVLVIELPRNLDVPRPPTIGSPLLRTPENGWSADKHIIELRPTAPKEMEREKARRLQGASSNVYIALEEPFGITMQVRITTSVKAVSRVIVTSGESNRVRSAVQRLLGQERAKLEAEFQTRHSSMTDEIELAARREMAFAVRQRHTCREFPKFSMRTASQLLTVFGQYICRFGDFVFLGFKVVNNRRDVFHLKEIRVFGDDQRMDAAWVMEDGGKTVELGLDEEVLGTAYLTLNGPKQPTNFAIEVIEDGGANRHVKRDDFEF